MKLITAAPSPYARKVRISLHEKTIDRQEKQNELYSKL